MFGFRLGGRTPTKCVIAPSNIVLIALVEKRLIDYMV